MRAYYGSYVDINDDANSDLRPDFLTLSGNPDAKMTREANGYYTVALVADDKFGAQTMLLVPIYIYELRRVILALSMGAPTERHKLTDGQLFVVLDMEGTYVKNNYQNYVAIEIPNLYYKERNDGAAK